MSVAFILCVVVLFVFIAVYAQLAQRVWRGAPPYDRQEAPPGWPGGTPAFSAFIRAYVAVGPYLILFLGAGALDVAEPGPSPALLAVSTVGLVLSVALAASIGLLNRPRRLVPPRRRDEPGVLDSRR